MGWFDFLIAQWSRLPEGVRQQVKAYEVLRRAAQFRNPRAALSEVQSLEAALKNAAHQYGWTGDVG